MNELVAPRRRNRGAARVAAAGARRARDLNARPPLARRPAATPVLHAGTIFNSLVASGNVNAVKTAVRVPQPRAAMGRGGG
jgi:hypothetical protein